MSETTGEVQGAPFISEPAGSFAEDSLTKGTSSALSDVEPFSFTRRLMRAGAAGISTYGEIDPESGRQLTDPDEKLPVDALQQKYSIPGKLTFDTPLPDEVARSMYQNKIGELRREAAAERRPSGFIAGATSMGVHALADSLDPLFIGSMFIPGIPEVDLGASVAGRIGARALSGGASGAAMMAPLAAMNYGLGRQEQSDYTAYQAMADIAVGAGLGAALHVGGGALGDWLTDRVLKSKAGRLIAESPDQRETTLRTVASQVLQDQPTDASIMFPDHVLTETEPGGWGAFPRGETVSGETVGEPPTHITEPPTPGVPTRGAVPFEPENEPTSLISFLRSDYTVGRPGDINTQSVHGGLRDPGGDLAAIIGGDRTHLGGGRVGNLAFRSLINDASGQTLDDAALRAWRNRYFPEHDQRPSINDLLNAIEDETRGTKHYSKDDQDAAQRYRDAVGYNGEILHLASDLNIPTQNITRAQFFDQVHSTLTPEDFDARVGTVQQAREDAYHQAEELAREWVAYHGTPHDFDRFDTGRIGTGEGAQAYGHGLYFAENEGIAENYRNQLSVSPQDTLNDFLSANRILSSRAGVPPKSGVEARLRSPDWPQISKLADDPEAVADIETILEGEHPDGTYGPQAMAAFDRLKGKLSEEPGHLYTVRIKAKPEEMLDWDKPLSEQPHVQEALRKAGFNENEIKFGNPSGEDAYRMLSERLAKRPEEESGGWTSAPGGPVSYDGQVHDPAASSKALHDAGIKGIRYADAQSRGMAPLSAKGREQYFKPGELVRGFGGTDKVLTFHPGDANGHGWSVDVVATKANGDPMPGERPRNHATMPTDREVAAAERTRGETFDRPAGTHNVVVFNHDDVEITHKNGEPVEPHAPSAAEAREISETHGQEAHGGFDAETFYGKDQNRSLEDLERERGQEDAATAARQRQGGDEPPGSAAAHQSGVQEGGGPGGRGAGPPGREDAGTGEAGGRPDTGADTTRGIAANDALRRASGERPTNPDESAADAAVKETPKDALRRAEQEVADHEEFFRRGEAEGGFGDLTREVQAELESIQGLDKEAKDVGEGAMQAAACVARGMGGGMT